MAAIPIWCSLTLTAQVSYYTSADVSSAYSNDIERICVSAYLTPLSNQFDQHWFVAGSVNNQAYFAGDSVPVIIIIEPNGNIQYTTEVNFNLNNGEKQLTPLDVAEVPGYGFAVCGKVRYDGAPGGTSGFILRLDMDLVPQDITIYDNLLTANALVYTSDTMFLIAGQSYLDYIQGDPYDSLPCVILVDGDDPSIYLNGYIVHNYLPNVDMGAFNDIEDMGGNHYALTGKFRVENNALPYALNYFNYDLLFSCFESSWGQINARENVKIYTSTDMSDEIGKRLKSNGTNHLFIAGESYDPVFQMNAKNTFAMEVIGNIAPGNLLNSLSYDFREVPLGNGTSDIYANGIDYDHPSDILAISGYYLDGANGYHPYILQSQGFLASSIFRNDFSVGSPGNCELYLQRCHIAHTNPIALGFGWEIDPAGLTKRLMIVGDEIGAQNQACAISMVPTYDALEVYPEALNDEPHYEHANQYILVYNSITVNGYQQFNCPNTPVFSGIGVEEKLSPVETNTVSTPVFIYSSDFVSIAGESGMYKIFNITGQSVMTGLLAENQPINITSLRPGFYVLSLEGNRHVYKFVK